MENCFWQAWPRWWLSCDPWSTFAVTSCSSSANSSANLSLATLPSGHPRLEECLDALLGAHCYPPLHHPAAALPLVCRNPTQSLVCAVSYRLHGFLLLSWSLGGQPMPRPLSLDLQPKSLGCCACGAYWARAARRVEQHSFLLHCSDHGPRRCPPYEKT